MTYPADLFPSSYESSRARFKAFLPTVQLRWPGARLISQTLDASDDLTLDWIEAPATDRKEKVLLCTIGEHGIEAYVGSAVQKLLVDEYLGALDPAITGVVLVHAINPWGMKHHRRVNIRNTDPNRNFVLSANDLNASINHDYTQANTFLNPTRPLRSWFNLELHFLGGLLGAIFGLGVSRFRAATLLGQYRFPDGIYYGGTTIQPEVEAIQALYHRAVDEYERILLLDMHTGYGPRFSMSVVNSSLEPRSSDELKTTFGYPNVVKTDPSEFYSIQGDMIDYIYKLVDGRKPLYATTFEFGTFGDSFFDSLRSLRAMIFENWLSHVGTSNIALQAHVMKEFTALYYPEETDWREKAVADARLAFKGILKAEGYC
jgi:predicted deacylase